MYQSILLPTDGSELAEKAVLDGIGFAKGIGAKVTILTVTRPFHAVTTSPSMLEDTPATYKTRTKAQAERTLGAAATAAETSGVSCEAVHVEDEHPYHAIIDTAQSKGCDLIVMASHGRRGIAALMHGSETVKVLTHSKIPVLVHR